MKSALSIKPGERFGVCAPSGYFETHKFNAGMKVLQDLGFAVTVPKEIFEQKRYLAGEDRVRASVINRLFADSAIDGIICARGGYGAMRILDYLDWDMIRQNPKPFIGFSDNTALLLSIVNKTGNPVIHGPSLVSFARCGEETIDSFLRVSSGVYENIQVRNPNVLQPGKGEGVLLGGNIATISSLVGTRYQPDFSRGILLLEDINEPAYKLDRMLTQMKMAGLFEALQGVVTGSFTACEGDDYIDEILVETFGEYDIPILCGINSGHGKINLSLPLGADTSLDTHTKEISWR